MPPDSPPAIGAADPGAARWRVDRRALPVWAIILAGALPLSAAVVGTDFTFSDPGLLAMVVLLASLAVAGWRLRALGYPRLGLFLEALALLNGLGVVVAQLSAVLAATGLRYVDADLAALDASLFGFSWLDAVTAVRGSGQTLHLLSVSYATLFWQPILLIATLLVMRREERVFVFVTAWAVCLSIAVMIFPFAPALGGYLHFGIAEASMPDVLVGSAWDHVGVLGQIRSGALRELSPDTLEGIITFPSFHAGGAVMLAWGFWRAGVLRWPAVALNGVMLPSSIFIGGHYLVDVVAGALFAVLSIAAAHRLVLGPTARRPAGKSQPANAIVAAE